MRSETITLYIRKSMLDRILAKIHFEVPSPPFAKKINDEIARCIAAGIMVKRHLESSESRRAELSSLAIPEYAYVNYPPESGFKPKMTPETLAAFREISEAYVLNDESTFAWCLDCLDLLDAAKISIAIPIVPERGRP